MPDSTAQTPKPVVNIAAVPMQPYRKGRGYESADGQIAKRIGLSKIGATYLEVPPGKSSCPYHVHHAEEEMFFILEGTGTYRFGDATYEVGPGDVLAAPCGGPEFAHKLTNTGAAMLRYLAISTKAETDICEYPDSGKFGVGTRSAGHRFGFIGHPEDARDYWDGEPDAVD